LEPKAAKHDDNSEDELKIIREKKNSQHNMSEEFKNMDPVTVKKRKNR
jgi:hypothetical protein